MSGCLMVLFCFLEIWALLVRMAGERCGSVRILSTLWFITSEEPSLTIKPTTRYNNSSWSECVRARLHMCKCNLFLLQVRSFCFFFVSRTYLKSTENCVCILHNLSYQMEAELPKSYARDFGAPRQSLAPEPKSLGCFAHRSAKITEVIPPRTIIHADNTKAVFFGERYSEKRCQIVASLIIHEKQLLTRRSYLFEPHELWCNTAFKLIRFHAARTMNVLCWIK